MDQARPWWVWWQALLSTSTPVVTRPGWGRFVQGVTGLVLGWEEHPITQIVTALGLASRWRVWEHCAESGAWDREAVERHTQRLIAPERPARWGRYHPVAVDDTTRHRTSPQVWGTCPVHESSARRATRAETVRAHHWGVRGDRLPGRPGRSLPHAARLSCRRRQRPTGETFQTNTALAVAMRRHAEAESAAPLLGVVDGA